jgi:hypothetical protein
MAVTSEGVTWAKWTLICRSCAAQFDHSKIGDVELGRLLLHESRLFRQTKVRVSRDVLAEIRDKVAKSKKQGKSLEQVVAEKPGAITDEEWGQGFINPAAFVLLVYRGV